MVFSTYHSALVVAAAQAAAGVAFDLVICDEAHRLAGTPRAEFRAVLEPRTIVSRRRLFMTATPRTVTAEGAYSMDDPKTFGVLAHTVTFGDAIAAGLLTDYQVLVIAGRAQDPVIGTHTGKQIPYDGFFAGVRYNYKPVCERRPDCVLVSPAMSAVQRHGTTATHGDDRAPLRIERNIILMAGYPVHRDDGIPASSRRENISNQKGLRGRRQQTTD